MVPDSEEDSEAGSQPVGPETLLRSMDKTATSMSKSSESPEMAIIATSDSTGMQIYVSIFVFFLFSLIMMKFVIVSIIQLGYISILTHYKVKSIV